MKNQIDELIYKQYVSAFKNSNAPKTIEGLYSRKSTLLQVIKKFYPKERDAKILDYACGHGALCYYSNQAGYLNTFGVDVSEEQISLGTSLGIGNLYCSDGLEFLRKLESESFDIIVAIDILEHLFDDELLDVIFEFKRILKKSGSILLHLPNGNSPFLGMIFYGDFTHKKCYTPSSIDQLFKSLGFAKTTSFEKGPYPHGFFSTIRFMLFRIVMLKYKFLNLIESGPSDEKLIFSKTFYTLITK